MRLAVRVSKHATARSPPSGYLAGGPTAECRLHLGAGDPAGAARRADYFFVHWPYARLPLMNRHDSLELLVAVNAVFAGYLWIARAFPRWRARRVAGTWSSREQERLMVSLQSRASR